MFRRKISSIALACPGQGVLPQGCLHNFIPYKSLIEQSLNCIDDIAQAPFSKHLLDPPSNAKDSWNLSTANAQLAILGSTYILSELFYKLHGVEIATHEKTSHILGHSLGEYTALVLGKVISFEDGLKLVRRRGQLMEDFVAENNTDQDYEMRVFIFKPSSFELIYTSAVDATVLACVNNETQISVSGPSQDIQALVQELNSQNKTILKNIKLPVKVPFHNKVLCDVEGALHLMDLNSSPSIKPIICNIDGAAHIEDLLSKTISATSLPVQWKTSMELLQKDSVEYVINIGPGNAVDAINNRFKIQNIPLKNVDDMAKIVKFFSS